MSETLSAANVHDQIRVTVDVPDNSSNTKRVFRVVRRQIVTDHECHTLVQIYRFMYKFFHSPILEISSTDSYQRHRDRGSGGWTGRPT